MDRVRKVIQAEKAYRKGYYGSNVTTAILDTGVFPHRDLKNQIICFKDFCNMRQMPYDENGHGTHIAGIIAGSGVASGGLYQGVAPKCRLVILKVMDEKGNGKTTRFIQAIDWILKNKRIYDINVVNISAGMPYNSSDAMQMKLLSGLEELWDAGMVVVTAAGNNGPKTETITVPGVSRTVITVGSSDDAMVRQKGFLKKGYSGVGPTKHCVIKPEILAPGTNIKSCSHLNAEQYCIKSGTSMATPVAAGAIALMLEKYPYMSPADVKYKLYEKLKSHQDLQTDGHWGIINVAKLMQM